MAAFANIVTIVHLAYFVFVVGGFIMIVERRSKWVLNPWFRIAHLLSVWIVLAEDVIGAVSAEGAQEAAGCGGSAIAVYAGKLPVRVCVAEFCGAGVGATGRGFCDQLCDCRLFYFRGDAV